MVWSQDHGLKMLERNGEIHWNNSSYFEGLAWLWFYFTLQIDDLLLRIPDSYGAKKQKSAISGHSANKPFIWNLTNIGQKGLLSEFEKIVY